MRRPGAQAQKNFKKVLDKLIQLCYTTNRKRKRGTPMELRTKDNWLYIMMDRKGADIALVKNGLSADTLYNRFHSYKTSNPWLECVAF